MTGGMMGRTSDTRIYNPRSESSEMFRANHEDERPPSGMEDGRDKEARKDKRQAKKEAEEKEDKKIRHIKVRRHHLGMDKEPAEEVDDEEEKFKPRGSTDNPSDQTMPSGAGGFMTSLAMGAKGPGAAGGEMIQMSEPMDIAWQLLKSDRSTARRRKKEGYAKWRPSTGQFERPKGGGDPRNATSRRAKNISRNLPLGRKTGLMKPHLSVEFSHRGLASKQPMSKDPQKYRAYLASQEARKLQGGVRSTVTPHMRHSQRSFISGQTGGGRLTNTLQYPRVPRPRLHAVRAPSIQPPKMKMPRLTRPKMPGMVTMSEDTPQHSDILKAGNAYQAALMRIALKEIRELMREKKDKDKKAKGKGNPDVAGAASSLPNYEANNPKTATRPEGGTEDENDSRLWGLSPGDLAGRGSGRV
ncbi:MAG: hypothetical protein CMI60_01640 [Parvibaculum sp.]|nr:hypothetical protein [Parvibaculum sp.]|tara:strand:- start:1651 stop:2892 length:1242 start_codon:yes stop_codon:yes gene_type:complete